MARRTGQLLFDKLRSAPGHETEMASDEDLRGPVAATGGSLGAIPREKAPQIQQKPSGIDDSEVDLPAPWVRVRGKSLVVTLTSTTAGVVAFLLLLLLGVIYQLGHSIGEQTGQEKGFKRGRESYSSSAISEIEQARQKSPQTDIVQGLLSEQRAIPPVGEVQSTPNSLVGNAGGSAKAPPLSSATIAWVEGHNYIIVQEFDGKAAQDAESARLYLVENEVPSVVVRLRNGKLGLVAAEGFNFREATQRRRADLLKERIARIGAKYFAIGGRYKLEGYFAAYRSGAWE